MTLADSIPETREAPKRPRVLRKTRGTPDDVDRHIGKRIKQRRQLAGLSQEKLAEALDLTFQQVQKYERGVNRVGGGRLYQLSKVLGVPVTYFYDGLDGSTPEPDVIEKDLATMALVSRITKLNDVYRPIAESVVRTLSRLQSEDGAVEDIIQRRDGTTGISIRIPSDLKKNIEERAKAYEMTVDKYIARILDANA